eukprot:SAG11_NODE_4587_length_1841_cov_9.406429_1_plen_124_part_00
MALSTATVRPRSMGSAMEGESLGAMGGVHIDGDRHHAPKRLVLNVRASEAVMKLRLDKRCKVAQWVCLIERVANSIVGPALAIQAETGAEWRACRDDRTRFWRLQQGPQAVDRVWEGGEYMQC